MCEPDLFFALQNPPIIEQVSSYILQSLPNGARSAFQNTIPNPTRVEDEKSELNAAANIFKPTQSMETPDTE
jgi:hypothetical protein